MRFGRFLTVRVAVRHKSFSVGLVGLANVGKSTLFNALAKRQLSFVGNFPFATINPQTTLLPVPDARLDELARVSRSVKVTPAFIELVDIAGLVRGASEGAGKGNAFLANISSVASIIHVVRAFDDPLIEHVEQRVDPLADIDIVNTELALKDLHVLDQRLKHRRTQPAERALVQLLMPVLEAQQSILPLVAAMTPEQSSILSSMGLLSAKKQHLVLNVDEQSLRQGGNRFTEATLKVHPSASLICGKLEAEIVEIDDESERRELLASYGVERSAFDTVASRAMQLLDARVFFTTGDTESRAWIFTSGLSARECAGLIHTDFSKNFVRAEVRTVAQVLAGLPPRIEGPKYVVQDGDVIFFRVGG
jgi:GTP-binding protein YchF